MSLETKSSLSAHWQLERSPQYPLIMTLEVIGFKGFRMHWCGKGGFRFPLLSYLQINVVHLVRSDCRPSCLLLHSARSADLSSHSSCLRCDTPRHNLHSAPSYLRSLFFVFLFWKLCFLSTSIVLFSSPSTLPLFLSCPPPPFTLLASFKFFYASFISFSICSSS